MFNNIKLGGWRQFHSVSIDVHPRLTVITGSNGAGKSTILSIFSKHFGWYRPFVSTPEMGISGEYSYRNGIVRDIFKGHVPSAPDYEDIGSVSYINGEVRRIAVPANAGLQYGVEVLNQISIEGIFLPSHRPVPRYEQVGQIPTNIVTADQAYTNYNSEVMSNYHSGSSRSLTQRMKESIIAMATFGEGNSYVRGNKSVLDAYLGFVEILSKVLPESIGFKGLSIRPPEVVIETNSGDFVIDEASGGIQSLIDTCWRLHMFSVNRENFVVVMDEPENHLHPSMQRNLLSGLLDAFPRAQFIVATHSPFMISSVKDSNVYALKYEENSFIDEGTLEVKGGFRVVSHFLDHVNRSGGASEILREVLGVPVTIPEWVERDVENIVSEFSGVELSGELLFALRKRLSDLGYEDLYHDAVSDIMRLQ